jgi:thioredoxin 1
MRKSTQGNAGASGQHILTVTDANLEKITRENQLILIDFWNERCEYCEALAPVIEGLAADYGGRVAFGKLDVDANRRTQMRFNVQAFPTLLILKNGREVDRIIGCVPREHIEAALQKQLASADAPEKTSKEVSNRSCKASECRIV